MAIFTPRNEVNNRTILANVLPLSTPFVLGIFVGDICNFKCKYCIHSTNNHDGLVKSFMSMETFEQIRLQIKEFPDKIKKILFSSIGEPLLNRNLPRMIEKLNSMNAAGSYEVVSNGSLLTKEMTRELVDSGLSRLCVSIQGVTEKKYKEICGYSINIEELLDNLRFFYEYSRGKCELHIKTVDASLEAGDKDLFMKMFSGISDTIFVDTVIEMYEGIDLLAKKGKHMFFPDEEYNKVNVCSPLFYTIYILANGDVVPCCRPPYPIHYGNIYQCSLLKCWNGSIRKNFLKMNLLKKRNEHKICKNCVLPESVTFKEDLLDDVASTLVKKFS